ncbi:sensor histidine kinase [Streptomyces xiamenensis]
MRMRAQVRNTTLRDPADPASPRGNRRRRGSRVRSRLLIGVFLSGIAVLGAGAPTVISAGTDYKDAQRLAEETDVAERALALAHTLADERDTLTAAVAAAAVSGSRQPLDAALTPENRARADRKITELRAALPTGARDALTDLTVLREAAEAGDATPLDINVGYTVMIAALEDLTRDTARATPPDAADPTADALSDLIRAVDSSAATRGLLLAALVEEGEQAELARLIHTARAREEAALADFTALAGPSARDAYAETVAGDEIAAAEEYLAVLAAGSGFTATDRALDRVEIHDTLAARTDAQRTVLADLSAEHTARLAKARDSELMALQIKAGVVLVAFTLVLAVSVQTARSLTRPLAAVRLGSSRVAADPTTQEPVKYTGRNDEFAEVVAAVNALHSRALDLHQRALEASRDSGGLRAERDRLLAEQQELGAQLHQLHGAVHGMFADHAERILILVSEQLSVLEGLEEHETDPDQLAVLFSLDHLAARVRRHGENLLLLAGAEPAVMPTEPMPLIDVLRAAVSEIERYEVVETTPPPAVRILGVAARDLSHLLAELLDNATAFSPSGARVRLTGWCPGAGQVLTLHVEDEGPGLSEQRIAELNARLGDSTTPPAGADLGPGIGMGLYTVARLAARHGLGCWLHARPGGGTVAEVIVPAALVESTPTGYAPVDGTGATPAVAGTQAIPTVAPADPSTAPAAPAGPVAPVPAQRDAPAVAPAPPTHPSHQEHTRAPDSAAPGAASWTPEKTENGLPVRTRGVTPVGSLPASETPDLTPSRGTDAEELRRRLGGFQRGARAGHRDAAAEEDGPA